MSEVVASEAPEQQREDRHPHEPGRHKSQQTSLEKCVNGRAGRAPRCMRALLVNEIVASETPERSMSLKCVPVKHESNTLASEIEPLLGGESASAKRKIDEIEPLIGTKKYISQKSASTTLRCYTGYHFNVDKSRRCSESTPFKLSMKNLVPEHLFP